MESKMRDQNPVTYVKVSMIDRRHYLVMTVHADGEYYDDMSYKTTVGAENRARRLAKKANCDWGCDF